MDKYTKATMHLNESGFSARKENNNVSVLLHNAYAKDGTRYWVYISESEVDLFSGRYDSMHGGYATLKEVLAWADKQPESNIIGLSVEELVNEYRHQTLES